MWNNNKTKLSSRYFFQISGSDLKAAQEGRWPCGKLHKTQPCRHSHRRCSTGAGSSLRPHTTDLRLCGFYSEKSVHGGSYVPEDKMATLKTLFPTLGSNTVLSQRPHPSSLISVTLDAQLSAPINSSQPIFAEPPTPARQFTRLWWLREA